MWVTRLPRTINPKFKDFQSAASLSPISKARQMHIVARSPTFTTPLEILKIEAWMASGADLRLVITPLEYETLALSADTSSPWWFEVPWSSGTLIRIPVHCLAAACLHQVRTSVRSWSAELRDTFPSAARLTLSCNFVLHGSDVLASYSIRLSWLSFGCAMIILRACTLW